MVDSRRVGVGVFLTVIVTRIGLVEGCVIDGTIGVDVDLIVCKRTPLVNGNGHGL